MSTLVRRGACIVVPFLASLALGCSSSDEGGASATRAADESALSGIANTSFKSVCLEGNTAKGQMRCSAKVRTAPSGAIQALSTPSGYGPADLQAAYNEPPTGAAGTVAIVDAYDDPNAESDLAVYRSTYGLPACTTANGCFKKVNQAGVQGNYPPADAGWAGEIALDIEMASALCPSCKILLVEATSASVANLGTSVNTAVSLGASVVSNSWGGSEDSSDLTDDAAYFTHPGVALFASAGDAGFGVQYPASSSNVIAVSGTTLSRSSVPPRGWTETGLGGGGCSSYEAKPTWQTDSLCAKRTLVDLAAVADPNTGVAVYDTYGGSGWQVYGGTSAASPIVAAIFAYVGKGSADGAFIWRNPAAFYDVTSGGGAVPGYDEATGWGTPNATAIRDAL